jgi:hypothetical protein
LSNDGEAAGTGNVLHVLSLADGMSIAKEGKSTNGGERGALFPKCDPPILPAKGMIKLPAASQAKAANEISSSDHATSFL